MCMNNLPKAIIVDLEGTLFLREPVVVNQGHEHFIITPIQLMIELVSGLANHHRILYVSKQLDNDKYREITQNWIRHNMPRVKEYHSHVPVFLAKIEGEECEQKEQIFEEHFKDKFDITCAIDDSISCTNMYEQKGVPTLWFNMRQSEE